MSFSRRGKIYLPLRLEYFLFYLLLSFLVFSWILFYGSIFRIIFDLPGWVILLIIEASLLGSLVNIPVSYVKSYQPIIRARIVKVFFIEWVVPEIDWEEHKTLIAVNLGGCIIPVLLSVYLIARYTILFGPLVLAKIILAVIINSLLINQVARPVPGIGIATPTFLPPLFTLLTCAFLQPILAPIDFYASLYITGSLGALIGADLMNLKKIPYLGAPVASIGGAGTFDGIFLTGLFAVWLALIL